MSDIKILDRLAIIFLVGAILILLTVLSANNKNNHIRVDEIKQNIVHDPFKNIKLTAKAAVVWDMKERKIIFGQNVDEVLPLASLTKAMTALTAIELIPDYTVVTISKEYLAEEGDSGFFADEKWKLKDLLAISLLSSSNDGARAVASVAGSIIQGKGSTNVGEVFSDADLRERFVYEMNNKAKSIGLLNSRFLNENGLDENSTVSGAYGTAHDVALLFDYIMRHHVSLLEPTRYSGLSFSSLSNIKHNAKNTNIIVNSIPGLMGSKTGLTDLAGGNLAVITDIGLEGPYVIVVLDSTAEERFIDVENLVKATNEYVTKK